MNPLRLFPLLALLFLTASAQAQVRFDVLTNPYTGASGVGISVGQNGGACHQPAFQSGYVVYPTAPMFPSRRRGRAVVVPMPPSGYYHPSRVYHNGYVVPQPYPVAQPYPVPVYAPGYGFPSAGHCR